MDMEIVNQINSDLESIILQARDSLELSSSESSPRESSTQVFQQPSILNHQDENDKLIGVMVDENHSNNTNLAQPQPVMKPATTSSSFKSLPVVPLPPPLPTTCAPSNLSNSRSETIVITSVTTVDTISASSSSSTSSTLSSPPISSSPPPATTTTTPSIASSYPPPPNFEHVRAKLIANQNSKGPRDKHGYLVKEGGRIKTWRKRWFKLDTVNKCLLYYKEEKDAIPIGIIPLINILCSTVEKKFTFRIAPFNNDVIKASKYRNDLTLIPSNHKSFILTAASKDEMDDWMFEIQKHTHYTSG